MMNGQNLNNFRYKCVCCSTTTISGNRNLIFSDKNDQQNTTDNSNNIPLMLFDCLGKELTRSSTAAICANCLVQLKQSYAFKQRCLLTSSSATTNAQQQIDEVIEELHATEDYVEVLELKEEDLIEYSTDHFLIEQTDDCEYIDEESGDVLEIQLPDDPPINNNLREGVLQSSQFSQFLPLALPEYITVDSYKQLFRSSAPTQPYKIRKPAAAAAEKQPTVALQHKKLSSTVSEIDCSDLDVEKIVTSDDLIKILEDDYHSESDSRRRRRLHKDSDDDEFKIPKIEMLDVRLDIDYLDEEKTIDLDAYLQTVTFTVHDANIAYAEKRVCKV